MLCASIDEAMRRLRDAAGLEVSCRQRGPDRNCKSATDLRENSFQQALLGGFDPLVVRLATKNPTTRPRMRNGARLSWCSHLSFGTIPPRDYADV